MFILVDDLGWTDIKALGGVFPTPALDELYSKSIHLNRHYIHLMCSPSRSQIITGRYAMHMGFGKMFPWDYTEIGGIPIGQPTIANWLRDFGNYDTYAIGKWHMGYAYEGLTPLQRGFNRFYGYYQGAIRYDTKKYVDILYNDTDLYDFWEDGECSIEETTTTINTMTYYKNKVDEYLYESSKKSVPFYMYVALQAVHVPFSSMDGSKYEDMCSTFSTSQQNYCMYISLTDEVVGDIINQLVSLGLYDDTLIVFTTDNGADIAETGCNYPLRGTKGSIFDGNVRTVAFLSGGIIPTSQHQTMRNSLFSGLDWTPTLLEFSGLLSEISTDDYTWDGVNQYSMIMNGDDAVSADEKRSEIVLNIGLRTLESASVVFNYQNTLYKYFAKDKDIDDWAFTKLDGCSCVPWPDDSTQWDIVLNDADTLPDAQGCDDKYLFNLIEDEGEMINLLYNPQCGTDAETEITSEVQSVVYYAKSMLRSFLINNDDLYSEHISCLWTRLQEGIPLEGNTFIAPFLTKSAYFELLEVCFESMAVIGNTIPDGMQLLYFNEWTVPEHQVEDAMVNDMVGKEDSYFRHFEILLVSIALSILVIGLCCAYDGRQCCSRKSQNVAVQTLLDSSIATSENEHGYGTL